MNPDAEVKNENKQKNDSSGSESSDESSSSDEEDEEELLRELEKIKKVWVFGEKSWFCV